MSCRGYIGKIVEAGRTGEEELRVEWWIRDVLKLSSGGSGDFYASPEFRFGDELWWLRLFPNVRDEGRRPASGWLDLHLRRYHGAPHRTFRFCVGLRGSRGVENRREVEFLDYGGWYVDEFCSRSQLVQRRSTLMPDGVFTVTLDIKMQGDAGEVDIVQGSHAEDRDVTLMQQGMEELRESLQRLLASGEDSDCFIKVQDKAFPAHRAILRARSPVFQEMFAHDMVEKHRRVVTMEDCDQETFPDFLEHVYTGSVEMISSGNVFSLYTVSEKYHLKTLKQACAEFIMKNLTVSSFCDAISLGIKHDDKELIGRATEFYCNNTLDIVKTSEWKIFLAENPTVGNELLIKQLTK